MAKELTDIQKVNRELCAKYPILIPRNSYGKKCENFDYSHTYLESIPWGWRVGFGESWAKDIQKVINNLPQEEADKIFIVQIKEKFGALRQYFSYYTDELRDVIDNYMLVSKHTCIRCGKPATTMSTNWVSPYCSECAEKLPSYEKPISINNYFKRLQEVYDDD